MKHSTRIIHASGADPHTKAVVPPVHFSTIFAMEKPSSTDGFQYGRVGNPTRKLLEDTLAALHGARHACVFSSGSAAISAVLATLKTGDHILCHQSVYEGTVRLLNTVFSNFGIQATFADLTKPETGIALFRKNTKMVWIENPTNPLLEVLDIGKIAAIAHANGAVLAVDNTLMTPILQKPLRLGADIVVESLTKAIGGHSDAMGGVVITDTRDIWKSVQFLQHTMGAVLSPFECFLILRGLKTLEVRVVAQQKNAKTLATWLQKQTGISRVRFPGIGSIISFSVNPKRVQSDTFLSKLKHITIAHSFGGPETLIQQPTTMMDLSFSQDQLQKWGIDDNFFRISVGLEHVRDMISDMRQALETNRQI